ncbi:selenide, water dikinase SelD [Shimia aestuarii]|uniref:Selenophosphate synthase n=1 Tax=Shimia aestuarii TaxID=254406 RepID=A0A1I4RLH3_9RHOB|nr:selenide, water dikinase SelD [Shimia aestuarii]SFM53064.1 selenophosphate synthase [Shimia aestuarii]
MMSSPVQLTRDLVLIGGGHAHALVLRMWGMRPLPGVRVTLINPGPTAPYSGMLPGHIAGHYARDDLDIDLVKLARFAGARLIMAPAEGIDPVARTIAVQGRGEIGYDVASIDVGIHAEMPGIEGFADHGLGAKPLDVYASRWAAFLDAAAKGDVAPEVAVIGGGVAGSELALAMAHALRARGCAGKVTVIEAGPKITGRTAAAERHLLGAMGDLGVEVMTEAQVARVEAERVMLKDGTSVPSRFTVGAAGAFAHGWLAETALPLTEDGFVRVRDSLQVEGFDDLFAVGDCAHMGATPRPKAGVFAVRAGKVLQGNLRAVLSGGQTRAFRPQKDYLKLISLGGKSAVAEKWGRTLAGPTLWRWKDHIDQKFMDKFRQLPAMTASKPPREVALEAVPEQPLCGGCGSKVGPGTLAGVLERLPRLGRSDVLSGPGDDAAVLQVGGVQQVVTTDHLRAFTEDFGLMARIATVHALGDIWAMGAAPQGALMSVTLPRMSAALQARSMEEILREAGAVLNEAGAEIVGGHSTMGSELTIGLTLTGLVEEAAITHAGARVGDVLILTRPIGSGTVLAAEMQGKARGADVQAVLAEMARPQGDAAAILEGAHAMTDVTGFGLAGHLMAMCRASGVAAELDLGAVPFYDGALDLAETGHRSTIWQANADSAPVFGATGARGALLHDPQTAGGLLAAVEAGAAGALVEALRAKGHQAAVIGRFETGAPAITAG